MKKLFLLAVLCGLLSCSDDDTNSTTTSKEFHPPAWTHGTWIYNAGGQEMGLKFSADNVCTVTNSTAICYKESLALYEGTQAQTSVTEDISETVYDVTINISGAINSYHIEKVSPTQINWVINSSSTATLTKQ